MIAENSVNNEYNEKRCRICHLSEEPICNPCKCRGSMKYVHSECLFQWIICSGKKKCEICDYKYGIQKIYKENTPNRVSLLYIIMYICKIGLDVIWCVLEKLYVGLKILLIIYVNYLVGTIIFKNQYYGHILIGCVLGLMSLIFSYFLNIVYEITKSPRKIRINPRATINMIEGREKVSDDEEYNLSEESSEEALELEAQVFPFFHNFFTPFSFYSAGKEFLQVFCFIWFSLLFFLYFLVFQAIKLSWVDFFAEIIGYTLSQQISYVFFGILFFTIIMTVLFLITRLKNSIITRTAFNLSKVIFFACVMPISMFIFYGVFFNLFCGIFIYRSDLKYYFKNIFQFFLFGSYSVFLKFIGSYSVFLKFIGSYSVFLKFIGSYSVFLKFIRNSPANILNLFRNSPANILKFFRSSPANILKEITGQLHFPDFNNIQFTNFPLISYFITGLMTAAFMKTIISELSIKLRPGLIHDFSKTNNDRDFFRYIINTSYFKIIALYLKTFIIVIFLLFLTMFLQARHFLFYDKPSPIYIRLSLFYFTTYRDFAKLVIDLFIFLTHKFVVFFNLENFLFNRKISVDNYKYLVWDYNRNCPSTASRTKIIQINQLLGISIQQYFKNNNQKKIYHNETKVNRPIDIKLNRSVRDHNNFEQINFEPSENQCDKLKNIQNSENQCDKLKNIQKLKIEQKYKSNQDTYERTDQNYKSNHIFNNYSKNKITEKFEFNEQKFKRLFGNIHGGKYSLFYKPRFCNLLLFILFVFFIIFVQALFYLLIFISNYVSYFYHRSPTIFSLFILITIKFIFFCFYKSILIIPKLILLHIYSDFMVPTVYYIIYCFIYQKTDFFSHVTVWASFNMLSYIIHSVATYITNLNLQTTSYRDLMKIIFSWFCIKVLIVSILIVFTHYFNIYLYTIGLLILYFYKNIYNTVQTIFNGMFLNNIRDYYFLEKEIILNMGTNDNNISSAA